jgi:hypothetical protein
MAILREEGALEQLNDEAAKKLLIDKADNLLEGADNVNTFADSLSKMGDKLKNFDLKKWGAEVGAGFTKFGTGLKGAIKGIGSFIASCWPLLIVILALVVAIVGLILYINHLKNTSPEGKLKSA